MNRFAALILAVVLGIGPWAPLVAGDAPANADPAQKKSPMAGPPPMVDPPRAPTDGGKRGDAGPPPPEQGGGSLAGVSAEDLRGAGGKRVLEDLRKRGAEASRRGDRDTRKVKEGGLFSSEGPQAVADPTPQAPLPTIRVVSR